MQFENYSIQDIRILEELGFKVVIANTFSNIPWHCDLYFSWWASGSIFPLIVATISRKPIIVVAGGNEAMLYRDSVTKKPAGYTSSPFWKKLATRITLRFSTKLLVVSNFMLKDVKLLGARDPLLVHNCVDTSQFKPKPVQRSYITSIFRTDRDTVQLKRGEVLIRAIAEVVKVYPLQVFNIIGKKGNDFQRLNDLVFSLNIENNIVFIDELLNSEVLAWIQKSVLYVQLSDTETFGLAIAEAMSCGVPVLVSRQGAIPEVVGECGIYVDHNSATSVARGIADFLALAHRDRDLIGDTLRKRIEDHYSYSKRKNQLAEIFENVLTNEYQ